MEQAATPSQRARLKRGMTLKQVADACTERGAPVSEGQISRIERGRATPRPGLRAVLADVLDLDVLGDFEVAQ